MSSSARGGQDRRAVPKLAEAAPSKIQGRVCRLEDKQNLQQEAWDGEWGGVKHSYNTYHYRDTWKIWNW